MITYAYILLTFLRINLTYPLFVFLSILKFIMPEVAYSSHSIDVYGCSIPTVSFSFCHFPHDYKLGRIIANIYTSFRTEFPSLKWEKNARFYLFILECMTRGHRKKFRNTVCKHMQAIEHMQIISNKHPSEIFMLAKMRGSGKRKRVTGSPECLGNWTVSLSKERGQFSFLYAD